MYIGSLHLELEITDGLTLKDKRSVVKSLLERLRVRFNVSAAEVDRLDNPRFASLAVVTVANDHGFVLRVLDKVEHLVASESRALLLGCQREVL